MNEKTDKLLHDEADPFEPVERMAAMLAELTKEVITLRMERDTEKERADLWYRHYNEKESEVCGLRRDIEKLIEKYEGEKPHGKL